ncbi:palmitoyltransferase, putative [Babesia caballi]|uniref:Palmitoyltransferase n=1 Tax=Babesia caballi TaxID=5871 RepID=A0AAV4LYG4_BABCB|nr:palmitoyltransferase, putative [Babesia caballi]
MKDAPKAAGPFETQLQLLEKQQGMLNYEVYRINCDSHRRGAWLVRDDFDQDLSEPLDPYGQADQDGLAQRLQVCRQEAEILQTEMHALYPQVAAERQASCAFGYPEAVLGTVSGLGVETICLTCNMVKPPRSHHCGLCGVCMIRQDHHCAWLNSCIAKNNQRSFAVFCASTCVVFLHNFYTLYVHFRGAYNRGRFHWFWDSCNVVFGIAVNAVIFAFNGYITLRFVRNMVTDVTYHEYLKKPEHVKKRFQGRVTGAWWDFTGLTFFKALANCGKFWRAG